MKKACWYRIHVGECPVCGSDQGFRVRVYGKKPEDPKDRYVQLPHSQTYDQCMR